MYPIEIRTMPARKMIGLSHRGAYMEIGKRFEEMGAMFTARNLWQNCGPVLGVYFDDPAAVAESELRSFAGAEWRGDELPEGFDQAEIPAGRVAVLTYKGPYAMLKSGYDALYGAWLPTSGETPAHSPCYEIYLNDPRQVAPEELLTEICLPLADASL